MILPEKSFSGNILVILDDSRGQKINFKVKYDFNIYATNWSTYNTLFWFDFDRLSNSSRVLMIIHHQSELIRRREIMKGWWRGVKKC